MLDAQTATFPIMVQAVISQLGTRNASTVADAVIARMFPRTAVAAQDEGAFKMFHSGVKGGVMREVKKLPPAAEQRHMAELYPELFPYIAALKRSTYYVPEIQDYATIGELIEAPSMMLSAYEALKQHGQDTLEEASRLHDLYQALVRSGRVPS